MVAKADALSKLTKGESDDIMHTEETFPMYSEMHKQKHKKKLPENIRKKWSGE